MFRTQLIVALALLLVACDNTDPPGISASVGSGGSGGSGGSSSSTVGGGGGTGGATSSSSSSGTGGACTVPDACTQDAECACLEQENECQNGFCIEGKCAAIPKPQLTPCQQGSYPWHVCDPASGQCVLKQPSPNCFSATTDGDPASGCDDNNPCTVDSVVNGECLHQFKGIGSACGDPNWNQGQLMQCWSGGSGEECCPVAPAFCSQEGTQAECADSSVCMQGQCWLACNPADPSQFVNPGACAGTQFPTCAPMTVGGMTRFVCK